MSAGLAPQGIAGVQGEGKSRERLRYAIAVLLMILLAVGLRFDALLGQFMADDYAQIAMLEGRYPVERSPLNLYSLSDGTADEGQALLDYGYYPWWSHPQMRLSMLRPLASAQLWLDHALFGNWALPYHVHSMLWWVAMLGVVAVLYARLLSPPVALLSFALLMLDEAHVVAVSWIANRCALLSAACSLLGLLAYLRFRDPEGHARVAGQRRDTAWAVLWFSLGLAAGEYAICTYGYVLAYELLRVRESLRERLFKCGWLLAPAAAFVLLRVALGVGAQKSSVYLDLSGQPLVSAWAMLHRLPALMADLCFSVRADYWTFGLPWTYALVEWGFVDSSWLQGPAPYRLALWWLLPLALSLLALMLWSLPRTGAYRHVPWLLLGGCLSVLPVLPSFPSSRLLILPLVGVVTLFAAFVVAQVQGLWRGGWRRPVRWLLSPLVLLLLAVHGGWAGYASRLEHANLRHSSVAVLSAVLDVGFDTRDLERKNLLILAAVEGGTSYYFSIARGQFGRTVPRTCRTLSLTSARHRLTRVAEKSFELAVLDGGRFVSSASDQLLHEYPVIFHVGERAELDGMDVTVTEVMDGLPTAVRVDLDVPLEDPSLMLLYPTWQNFVQVIPPPIGQAIELPSPVIPHYWNFVS